MKTLRYLFLERLYEWSKKPYRLLFKKNLPWPITAKDLLTYPPESLGFHLGCFLLRHHFELEPQLEDHDVFHVLTGSGISVPEEIGMQFYLFGNGKRSLYLFLVMTMGTLLFPEEIRRFHRSFRKGKQAHPFYNLDIQKLLHLSLRDLRYTFKITSI